MCEELSVLTDAVVLMNHLVTSTSGICQPRRLGSWGRLRGF